MSVIVQPDHLKWTCANVLSGVGDSFSTFGAQAFIEEAEKNDDFTVCETNYNPGSGDMDKTSGDMDKTIKLMKVQGCCKATVVFAQIIDYPELLRAAYDNEWEGEWILGSNVGNGIEEIINNLKKDKEYDDAEIYGILRGTFM